MIKVSGIMYKRPKQSDPRHVVLILQNIYLMNGNFNNKEERNYAMLLTIMSETIKARKQKDKG